MLKNLGVNAAALILLGVSGTASAIPTSYDFNLSGPDFGIGPYGTVDLMQNGTDVDFTVTLRSDMNFVNTGNPNAHTLFSFNAINTLVGDIDLTSISFNGFTSSDFYIVSPGGNSPFGGFDFAIECSGCANGAPGQLQDALTFTVNNAVVADLVQLNDGGYYFAADVICDGSNQLCASGLTGAIGVGDRVTVPVPGIIGLLGLGLLGLGASRKIRGT